MRHSRKRIDPLTPGSGLPPRLLPAVFVLLATAGFGCGVKHAEPDRQPSRVASPGDPADPAAVARAFNSANRVGDETRALALSNAATDSERQAVRIAVRTAAAVQRVRRAVAQRFGPEAEYE